eukprot:gene10065-18712_t
MSNRLIIDDSSKELQSSVVNVKRIAEFQDDIQDLPMEQAEVSSDEESDGDNRGVGEHIDADMESEPEKEDGEICNPHHFFQST